MNSQFVVIAGTLGFTVGFVGWYATFRLAGPLAKLLTSEWSGALRFTRVLTLLFCHIFLLLVMFGLLQQVLLFIAADAVASTPVRAAVVLSSFAGLFAFGLIPRIEARLRGVVQYTDGRDKL